MRRLAGIWGPTNTAQRYSTIVGDGAATSFTITHRLGRPVVVAVYDLSQTPPAQIGCEVQRESANAVALSGQAWEAQPPALNSLEVVVVG